MRRDGRNGCGDRAEEGRRILIGAGQDGPEALGAGGEQVVGHAPVRQEDRALGERAGLGGGAREDHGRAVLSERAQKLEGGPAIRRRGQVVGVLDEDEIAAANEGARAQGPEAIEGRELAGPGIGEALQGGEGERPPHVIGEGGGAREGEGGEEVLADGEALVERGGCCEESDRCGAVPAACGAQVDRTGRGRAESGSGEEECARSRSARVEDRGEGPGAETEGHSIEEVGSCEGGVDREVLAVQEDPAPRPRCRMRSARAPPRLGVAASVRVAHTPILAGPAPRLM